MSLLPQITLIRNNDGSYLFNSQTVTVDIHGNLSHFSNGNWVSAKSLEDLMLEIEIEFDNQQKLINQKASVATNIKEQAKTKITNTNQAQIDKIKAEDDIKLAEHEKKMAQARINKATKKPIKILKAHRNGGIKTPPKVWRILADIVDE